MAPAIYLVNPACDTVSYLGTEVFAGTGLKPVAHMIDLAIVTVAGFVPEEFEVTLCDESTQPVDLDVPAEFVGITGKISQWGRMKELAEAFRKRGKVVLIGGPHASLCPELVRPHCDILVRGEIEEIAEGLFADLRAGTWKAEYVGTRPDLARTPMPRLDLYPNDRTLLGAIQTSRGCPFECEFCDVIRYLGRRQRHKPVERVLDELDQLYRHGYRYVLLTDDNLTACRSRAKELLTAIRDWNRARKGKRVGFGAQVSIDAARDRELLTLCAEAGIVEVFIGIETPNEQSLREAKKRQNLKIDLVSEVERFLEHGIKVIGGMIVGFDSDDPGIFQRQYEFAMSLPVPLFTLGPLVALAATPLHARLKQEGRLIASEAEVIGRLYRTNIVPKQMTREQLRDGIRSLSNRLYDPRAFGARLMRAAELLDKTSGTRQLSEQAQGEPPRPVELEGLALIKKLALLGPAEARLVWKVVRTISKRPQLAEVLPWYLIVYMQVRHAYELGGIWKARSRVLLALHRILLGALLKAWSLFGGLSALEPCPPPESRRGAARPGLTPAPPAVS